MSSAFPSGSCGWLAPDTTVYLRVTRSSSVTFLGCVACKKIEAHSKDLKQSRSIYVTIIPWLCTRDIFEWKWHVTPKHDFGGGGLHSEESQEKK